MQKALLILLLMSAVSWGAYTATITPTCTVCNLNDEVNFSVAVSPSITTTYDVAAYVAEFVPPSITIIRGGTANWRFIDNAPYTHVVHVADDGGAWQTGDMGHNAVASYTFNGSGFYSYRLQPPIEGAPTTTVGNLTVEEKPGLNITTPSSGFPLELNGSGTTYNARYFIADTSPTGTWTVDFNYTDSKNSTGKATKTLNVTTNLVINVSTLPQMRQEQDIAIPVSVKRAAGTSLAPGESASITCTDITQNQANTTASTGSSATCNFANLTVFGVHTVNVTAYFHSNYATFFAYYNVSYYYQTVLTADAPTGKYNLGTAANLTAALLPLTGSPGFGNFTILEPDGSAAKKYPVSGTGNFTQTYTFGTTEGIVNISFDLVDASGRRAHSDTSVVLTKNLTIRPAFPAVRQEGNITLNLTVTDINNRTLAGATVTYADLNETMGCTSQTDTNGATNCTFTGIKNFGWHTVFITSSRGSNYGNLTTRYFVDGYYPTSITFRRLGSSISTINLKEFFDISAGPTNPNTGAFVDGLNVTGAATNTLNCMPTYTPMAGEYLWRACDGGSTTGQQTVSFLYNGTDGHVAYATKNITVSSQYSLSVTPLTAEFVAGQTSTITITIKDVNGASVDGANVTCKEGTNTLTATASSGGTAICSFGLPVGTRTINITANKNYNYGSMLATYVFSTTGSTQGPSTVAIPPQMAITDYPTSINITAGKNTTVTFTVWNKGTERSPANYIKFGTISQGWYHSPTVEVYAGEKKNIPVDLSIPADAQPGDYFTTATIVGTLCNSKVVYPNGTYYYVGGDCESKAVTLTVRTEQQVAVAQAKQNLTITTDKQVELTGLLDELKKVGLNSSQIEAYLEAGNKGIEEAKKQLNASNASAASSLVDEANKNYEAAIAKAKEGLKGAIEPLISTVESKLATLTNASASEMDIVDSAKATLTEAKKDYADGKYSDAKAKLDKAYALIQGLQPKAPPKKPAEAKPFSISYTQVGLVVLLVALAATYVNKKDAIKEKLSPFLDSMKGQQKLINKYAWPEKISSHEEGMLTISVAVKNTFAAPIKNIEILDVMPLGFNLVEGSFNTGSANIPVEIGKTLQGKAFRWKIAELSSGKSANITYKVSVIPIGDQIKLPSASLKYTDRTGKETKQASPNPLVDVTP